MYKCSSFYTVERHLQFNNVVLLRLQMYSDHFAFDQDQQQQPGLTRAGSLHNPRQTNGTSTSFRPRSVSAGNKTTSSQQQQPTSPYLQRISSRSSPLLSASAKKSDLDKKAALQQVNLTGSRYKTELCRPFQESGTCKYGDRCQFAHGADEIRTLVRHPKYKTELCRTFHSTGFCPYGPRCHFVHNPDEAREAARSCKGRKDSKNESRKDQSPPLSPFVDSGISSPSSGDVFVLNNNTTTTKTNISSQDPIFVFPSAAAAGDDDLKSHSQPELGSSFGDSPVSYNSARSTPTKLFSPEQAKPASSLLEASPGSPYGRPVHDSCSLEEAVTTGLQQLHINNPYASMAIYPYNYL